MRIQHNIMAMNSYRNLGVNNGALSKNLEKLSSGYRINRAGDDAAGLAISEKMRAQIAGLDQAQKNAQSGINLVKTAEGALTEVHDMLNRMVTLATQSANGTYVDSDRSKIQAEVDALTQEIDRIAENSNFNGQKLLDGSLAGASFKETQAGAVVGTAGDNDTAAKYAIDFNGLTGADVIGGSLTIGSTTYDFYKTGDTYTGGNTGIAVAADANAGAIATAVAGAITVANYTDAAGTGGDVGKVTLTETTLTDDSVAAAPSVSMSNIGGLTLQIGADASEIIKVSVDSMSSSSLEIDDLDVGTVSGANEAIETLKTAIETVSTQRGALGAIQNRLEHTINNLGVMEENIQDAESTIRDTDIAEEMMAYTKNNILIQSAQAMLAQANQVPQGVLQLMQ